MKARFWRGGLNILLMLVLLLGSLSSAQAAAPADEGTVWYDRMGLAQAIGGGSFAIAVDAQNHYAYFGAGAVLVVNDVFTKPGHVKAYYETSPLHGIIRAIKLAGQYAYVAADDAGLVIFDLSDPMAPKQVSAFDLPGTAQDVVVSGGLAYVASLGGGLAVINVSDPVHPQGVNQVNGSSGYSSLVLIGQRLYALNPYSGLYVYDVSVPASIPTGKKLAFTGSFYHLASGTGYLYAGSVTGQLQVISLADPANPVLVSSSVAVGGSIEGMVLDGSVLYIADGYNRVCKISLSSPAQPSGTCPAPPFQAGDRPYANGIVVAGSYVYTAYNDGMHIQNKSDLSFSGGYLFIPAMIEASAYLDGKLYVVGGSHLFIVDAKKPVFYDAAAQAPNQANYDDLLMYQTTSPAKKYAITTSSSYKLNVLDVTDPANVSQVYDEQLQYLGGGCSYVDMDISGGSLYLLARCGSSGILFIYSLNSLPSLTLQTTVDLHSTDINRLDVFSWSPLVPIGNPSVTYHYAYVALRESGVLFYDLTDPNNIPAGSNPLAANSAIGYDVAVAPGNTVFSAPSVVYVAQDNQVGIYSPDLKTLHGTIAMQESCRDVLVTGGFLFTGDYNRGVAQYNIAARTLPQLVGHANIASINYRLVPGAPGQIYAADEDAGLQILNLLPNVLYLPNTMR